MKSVGRSLTQAIKHLMVVLISIFVAVLGCYPNWAIALASRAFGGEVRCPWSRSVFVPLSTIRFQVLRHSTRKQLRLEQVDGILGIERIRTPARGYWIKKSGRDMDGLDLLAFVIAEQQWISEHAPDYLVQPGDVVVDVGAHIGTFGDDALRRGAAKVIMVEPDPVNVECLRRNFAEEIASGKVVVVPEGAWSKRDRLRLSVGVSNSGTGSFVFKNGQEFAEIAVRPLDEVLGSLGIERVNFIKMDIEGAEREALRGAAGTLARWQPRLMLDMYHLPDDDIVLPQVIAKSNPAYRSFCAVCTVRTGDNRLTPYASFLF
ncbi:MAG TPA: FkbM family methyltransferase [Paludibaculum sp.]|jgi:FkbM family methyltransferase